MARYQKFIPKLYMEQYVVENGLHTNPLLKYLHNLYSTCGKSRLTVLELGCGPNIMQAAIAAPYASEIVLADYAEQNLKEINKWLEGQDLAHDWTPMLTHIVTEIEGKKGTEEVAKREQLLKMRIQDVIHCDVTQDPVISDLTATQYMKEYDVVQTFLCLEAACVTKDEYTSALRRIWSLVKPGGMFILYTINRKESPDLAKYMLGTETFYDLRVSLSFVVKSMADVGFTNINSMPCFETDFEAGIKEHKTTALVSATKPLCNPQKYHD